jgi:di/tricarboxylate transporter
VSTVRVLVTSKSPIVGETVSTAGLRHLEGLYLIEVTRADGTVIPAVSPDTMILENDDLLFAGIVKAVTELYLIPGIVPASGQSEKLTLMRHRRRLVELVISSASFLAGRTAKEVKFRTRFDSAIIAVHRHGDHVKEKIADIRLQAGDSLLVETGENFIRYYGKDSNFALVSEVSGSQPPRSDFVHMAIAAGTLLALIGVVSADELDLLSASVAAVIILIGTGCLTFHEAAHAVNLPVVLTIAASFGVSAGLDKSGAARAVAFAIINALKGLGVLGILGGIYLGSVADRISDQ